MGRDVTEQKRIERALRESEERFRAIVETTPECVKLVRADGTLLHMNSSGLAMVGAASLEMVAGKNVYDIIAPHDRDRYRAFNERICRGEKGDLQFDIVSLDGTPRHMETHAAPLWMPDGSVVHLAITLDVTERSRAENELRSSKERLRTLADELEAKVRIRTQELDERNAEVLQQSEALRELSNRLVRSQDEERRRISRELHDGVGQLLAALSMNVAKLATEKSKLSESARRSLDESTTVIDQALQEVRTMSYLLHPPLLEDMGLESALRWYVEGFAERSKISVDIEMSPNFSRRIATRYRPRAFSNRSGMFDECASPLEKPHRFCRHQPLVRTKLLWKSATRVSALRLNFRKRSPPGAAPAWGCGEFGRESASSQAALRFARTKTARE